MPKRKETVELENALHKQTREKRIYGCEEVTIGFYHDGHGDEIVDFMTMDSKGIIKCYEIKVTLSDLKSKAKKSWYGHYNYLVVSSELYDSIPKENWDEYIPKHVGIIRGTYLESQRPAKKQQLNEEVSTMLKESMIRSMYWKMNKYRSVCDMSKFNALKREIKEWKRIAEDYKKRYEELWLDVVRLRRLWKKKTGKSGYLEDIIEQLQDE